MDIKLNMKNNMKISTLIKFIKENPDWETKLTADPYNLKIRKKDKLIGHPQ